MHARTRAVRRRTQGVALAQTAEPCAEPCNHSRHNEQGRADQDGELRAGVGAEAEFPAPGQAERGQESTVLAADRALSMRLSPLLAPPAEWRATAEP